MPDPNQLAKGFMQGFPPSPDQIIRFQDGSYYKSPQLKWTFSNLQQLAPTKTAWRGTGAASALPKRAAGLDQLTFTSQDGQSQTWRQAHLDTETDAIAVLQRGELLIEDYFGATGPNSQHAIHSCTKSIAGLMAETMIEEGVLDEQALIPHYLPELAKTAWTNATLRDLLDMQIDMDFNEDYPDPTSDVWTMLRAAGQLPLDPAGNVIGFTDFLPTVKSAGPCGKVFAYREPNIFVLTWLLCRARGMHLNEHLSEWIWKQIGAEHDVKYLLDNNGFCTSALFTLRDFLRLGEAVRTGGNGLISDRVRASIFQGGDQEKFALGGYDDLPGWSYRSQFWCRHHEGRVIATMRGAHGQILYIDPENELVIARFGSTEIAKGNLHYGVLMPMFDEIAKSVA